nr:MAG TPA: hypothetical protein [Caudoviricetes sp.]
MSGLIWLINQYFFHALACSSRPEFRRLSLFFILSTSVLKIKSQNKKILLDNFGGFVIYVL